MPNFKRLNRSGPDGPSQPETERHPLECYITDEQFIEQMADEVCFSCVDWNRADERLAALKYFAKQVAEHVAVEPSPASLSAEQVRQVASQYRSINGQDNAEAIAKVLAAEKPGERKEYPHLLFCNGSRKYPAGVPGHSCCCLNIAQRDA